MAAVGGLLAIILGLVKIMSPWGKKNGKSKMERQVDELWAWHSKEDSDGVKMWYVRPSLEKTIERLAANFEVQTKLLETIDRSIESIRKVS